MRREPHAQDLPADPVLEVLIAFAGAGVIFLLAILLWAIASIVRCVWGACGGAL